VLVPAAGGREETSPFDNISLSNVYAQFFEEYFINQELVLTGINID
jgi:hypothetical protein